MTIHWKGKSYLRMLVNGFGAFCCLITSMIVIISKFTEGAWIILIFVPLFIYLFKVIKNHYEHMKEELRVETQDIIDTQNITANKHYFKVFVPLKNLNKGTLNAIKFAKHISQDVTIVIVEHHLATADSYTEKKNLGHIWETLHVNVEIIHSEYHSVIFPILDYIYEIEKKQVSGEIMMILPEIITKKKWHSFLHNHTTFWLKHYFYQDKKNNGTTRVVIDIPYYTKG
jgi:Ca2+/Na+ antiporter